jgi:2-hydroxychromene-2-carboxylate isomerase
MQERIEFLFDFASPNCYVALAKLNEIRKERGGELEVAYSPVFLGGLFKMTNDSPVDPATSEFHYMENNLRRLSARLGIGYNFSRKRFPVNSLRAMRGFYFANSQDRADSYTDSVFRACWSEDHDISDKAVLLKLVQVLDLDSQKFEEFVEKDDTKLRLRDDTQRAFDRGVFGAPTFFVKGEMFWGSPEILWFLESSRTL